MCPEDEVVESWDEFIHTHHYSYHNSFFTTTLGRCPRRSCEATFDRLMNNVFLDEDRGFRENMDFIDIDKLTCDLIIEEQEKHFQILIKTQMYKISRYLQRQSGNLSR